MHPKQPRGDQDSSRAPDSPRRATRLRVVEPIAPPFESPFHPPIEASVPSRDPSFANQATIAYDVFVSKPVDAIEARPEWPGPDRRKFTQLTLLPWGTPSRR